MHTKYQRHPKRTSILNHAQKFAQCETRSKFVLNRDKFSKSKTETIEIPEFFKKQS